MFGLFKKAQSDEAYWKAIAERDENELRALRKKYLASTAANQELSNSNQRLADALAAKNERLKRIVEAFEGQQSGTAQKAVRMARGDA